MSSEEVMLIRERSLYILLILNILSQSLSLPRNLIS